MKQTTAAWGMILLLGCSVLVGSARIATASTKGRRNTTLLLGAATLGTALAGKKKAAWVLGAGTAVAGYRWYGGAMRDKRKRERARQSMRVASFRSVTRPRSRTVVARRPASAARVVRVPASPVSQVAYAPPAAAPATPAPVAVASLSVVPSAGGAAAPAPAAPARENDSSLPVGAMLFGGGALAAALGVGLWNARRRKLAA